MVKRVICICFYFCKNAGVSSMSTFWSKRASNLFIICRPMSSFNISIGHLSIGLLILASMQTVHTGNRRQLLQTPRSLFSKEYGLFIMDSVPSGVICPMGVAREKSIAVHKSMQNRRTQKNGARTGISEDARSGVTHLSTVSCPRKS